MAGSRKPAVTVVVAYLTSRLGMPVWREVPRTRPRTFVRVVRVEGVKSTPVTDNPMMVIECWAPNSVAAEGLSGRVADILEDAPSQWVDYVDEDGIKKRAWITGHHEVSGPKSFDDPSVADQSRWTFTVQLGIATHI